jgi:NAD(P)-dependent dehydrogenase (short-subunit alcohol dehydrogenase family)
MKIAITGHSNGIGKSFAGYLLNRGHDIVGLSKRDGNNIRNIPSMVEKIVPCDMFINNAQAGYAQTELFQHVVEQWKNDKNKMIWNISTVMASDYKMPTITGMIDRQLAEYRTQKRALEDAIKTARSQGTRCRIILIRPGAVATQTYNQAGVDSADVDAWTSTICNFYTTCREHCLYPDEISLSFKQDAPKL